MKPEKVSCSSSSLNFKVPLLTNKAFQDLYGPTLLEFVKNKMSESPRSQVLLNYLLYSTSNASSVYVYVYSESKEIRNSVVNNIRLMKGRVILPEQKAYVESENEVVIILQGYEGILSRETFSAPKFDGKFQRVFCCFLNLKANLSMQFTCKFNDLETSFALSPSKPRRLSKSGPVQINVLGKKASGVSHNLGIMQESYISVASSGSSNEISEEVLSSQQENGLPDESLQDEQSFIHL